MFSVAKAVKSNHKLSVSTRTTAPMNITLDNDAIFGNCL